MNTIRKVNYGISYLYIAWACTPLVNRNFYIAIPIILIWIISAVNNSIWRWKKEYLSLAGLIVLWESYEISLKILGYSTAGYGNYMVRLCFWFNIGMSVYYLNNQDLTHIKNMCKWILVVFTINTLDNIRINLMSHDMAINAMTLDALGTLPISNVGFTSFSIAIVITFLAVLYLYLAHRIVKIYGVIILTSFLILIFLMARGASIIILMLGICVYIAKISIKYIKGKKGKIMILLIGVCAGGVIIGLLYRFPAIVYLIPNDRLNTRLHDMLTNARGSSFNWRIKLAQLSFNTFLQSPKNIIMGIGYHMPFIVNNDFSEAYRIGLGGHSAICDLMGKYGLIGIAMVGTILKQYYKITTSYMQQEEKEIYGIICILAVMYNTLASSVSVDAGIALLFFVPFCIASKENRKADGRKQPI